MKNIVTNTSRILLIFAAFIFAFASCDLQDEQDTIQGSLEFSFQADDLSDGLKSALSDTINPDTTSSDRGFYLLISAMGEAGEIILDKEIVPLYRFSDRYMSGKIELKPGVFQLVEFMVVSPEGEIVYAAPKENAPLAHLVKDPLPVEFKIHPGNLTQLSVEVLPVGNHPPEDFGYVSFGIHVVRPLKFYIAVYNDLSMAAAPIYMEAVMEIYGPGGWNYKFDLEASVNELTIRGDAGEYTFAFVVTADGQRKKFVFYLRDLLNTSPENPLLLPAYGQPAPLEMIIRAAPDSTADALITDLNGDENFGDHKFFAASFRNEGTITVMRTTRSLMYLDISRYLPKSATIVKVELELYVSGAIYTSDAASSIRSEYQGVLKQIIEPWEEDKVTWNNQPKTTDFYNVQIYYDPWIDCLTRIYDVTPLFVQNQNRDMEMMELPNYGFMFMHSLNADAAPGGIEFASSDSENENERPVFRVYYTLPD